MVFCCTYVKPSILASTSQLVALSFTLDNTLLASVMVYASTNQSKRKELWKDLLNLQATHHLPWYFLCDLNYIMGAHEHKGNTSAKSPKLDFQVWYESNNLIHIPTKGAKFTL